MAGLTLLVLSNPAARFLTVLERLPAGTRIIVGESEEMFSAAAAEADVILTGGTYRDLLSSLWPRATRLRWVHSLAAGLEGILFPQLIESAIPLTNSRGVFARSLGEFALTGMLHFAKDLPRMARSQREGKWDSFDVEELHGKTLGIVGFGEIGRASARLARAFGMKIIAMRRKPAVDELVDAFYPREGLGDLIGASDYLLVAAPLTPETRGMIGASELARMRPHGVIINLGRGPVIVEPALVEVLRAGRIRGAVLDVFDEEPLPPGHPFYSLDNVLMSAHCADHVPGWMEGAVSLFVDNFERFAAGRELRNVVDKRGGY